MLQNYISFNSYSLISLTSALRLSCIHIFYSICICNGLVWYYAQMPLLLTRKIVKFGKMCPSGGGGGGGLLKYSLRWSAFLARVLSERRCQPSFLGIAIICLHRWSAFQLCVYRRKWSQSFHCTWCFRSLIPFFFFVHGQHLNALFYITKMSLNTALSLIDKL